MLVQYPHNRLNDFCVTKHSGFNRPYRKVGKYRSQLGLDYRRRKQKGVLDALGILRSYSGDDGRSVNAESGKRFYIRLNTRPAA
jgi:hypothetical protein